MSLSFWIPGAPVPYTRARRVGNRYFLDAKTIAYRESVRRACGKRELLTGAVAVVITAYLVRPKSSKRADPTIKPDIDNIAKQILDALNGIAWKDDAQVVRLTVQKRYDDSGEGGVDVWISNY